MQSVTLPRLVEELSSGTWKPLFSGSSLSKGKAFVAAKQLFAPDGEQFDTGDIELRGVITEKSGETFEPVVTIWQQDGRIFFEGDCRCEEKVNCCHAAGLLFFLSKGKGERLEQAIGGTPHAEEMTGGQSLSLATGPEREAPLPVFPKESEPKRGSESNQASTRRSSDGDETAFLLRVEKRSEGERSSWLPEIFASAFAVYEGHRVPLSPGGTLPPIVLPGKKITRNRAAETAALQCLYSLDLLPGAEKPPVSLRRLDRPSAEGTLWAPDQQSWPHPEFFWQRFRHEGVPALERRGWEVRFAPEVGYRPLVFHSENWRAEIVEEGKGWFHLSAGFEIDGEAFELQPILAALVKNRFLKATAGMPAGQEFLIFLPDGRGLALPVGRFRRLLETLGELMNYSFTKRPIRLSQVDMALLLAKEEGELLGAEAPAGVSALTERLLAFERIDRVPLPHGLQAELRDYQIDGYCWMQFLLKNGLHGILADDMGLGKTLQSLTHILAEVESGNHAGRPSLVIAPTSVVMTWFREAEKFAPSLRILPLQGAERKCRFREVPNFDLILTSYALLHRDLEELSRFEFHLLILDEAQHIKNADAQVARAAGRLKSRHRLCLSGTPIENHLGELWSLMHFLMPGMLGSAADFRSTYQTPIEKSHNEAKRRHLAARVGPLILRRTKHDVAKELPPKTEIVHPVEMGEAQKDLYETVRSTMDRQVRQALAIRGQEAQVVFLDALLKLRQICCHPNLLQHDSPTTESAKFLYLVDLLETMRDEGHRTLIFSQFTSMLALIEDHLLTADISYLKLTGGTKDRQNLVERFQAGEGEVFLISLKAGGTGLTLTGADTIIHYDPWWNPAAENQATDRAYRIGQDKPVFVHKLICRNTVEERIQQMQARKGNLAGVLLAGATSHLNLTPDTLASLLGESPVRRSQ